jgi:hypothetical protein
MSAGWQWNSRAGGTAQNIQRIDPFSLDRRQFRRSVVADYDPAPPQEKCRAIAGQACPRYRSDWKYCVGKAATQV